jgi:glycosyltransferase involved in cell wall biosynthesis
MAMKIPCVTTPLANTALQAKEKEAILTGNNAKELADALLFLLENDDESQKMAARAFAFVKQNYHWQQATLPMVELIEKSKL